MEKGEEIRLERKFLESSLNKKEIAELSNQVKKLNEEKGIDRIRKVFDCSQVHGKGQEKEEGPLKCIKSYDQEGSRQPKELSVTEASET